MTLECFELFASLHGKFWEFHGRKKCGRVEAVFFLLLLYYPSCKRVIFEKTFWANTKWVLNCILNAKWWGRFKTMHFLSCILHLVLGAYLAMWYYLLILVPAKLLSNLITLIRNICNYKSKIFSAHSKRRFMSMLFAYGCPLLLIPTLFIFIT